MAGAIYIARDGFVTSLNGRREIIKKGVTRVREGHILLDLHPEKFKPIDVHFDVEDASAEPGAKRGTPQIKKKGADAPKDAPPEPDATKDAPSADGPRHVGFGRYETPDGVKHESKDAALAHMGQG